MADVMGGQAQIVHAFVDPGRTAHQERPAEGARHERPDTAARSCPACRRSPRRCPAYESQNWWGVLAPAGTPPPVLDRLYGAMSEVLQSKETGKRMESEGAETVRHDAAGVRAASSAAELAKWVKVSGATSAFRRSSPHMKCLSLLLALWVNTQRWRSRPPSP